MTEQEHQTLESKGYRRHNNPGFGFPYSDFFYQKRFDDNKGKRYYVELVHYDNIKHWEKEPELPPDAWMCHMNINDPHMTFDQHHVKLEDLDKLEGKCNLFFETMGCEYYELFERG